MLRVKRLFLSVLFIAVLTVPVAGQDRVTVSFSNTWYNSGVDVLAPGPTTISFTSHILTGAVSGLTNGFVVYEAAGGLLPPLTGSFPPYPGLDGGTFVHVYHDTIGFGGFSIYGGGLPIGSDVYYTATTEGVAGQTICVDTAYYPPGGIWLWSTNWGDVFPDWYDQPYCLQVLGCKSAGAISNCPETVLVYDHCGLATYDFDSPDESGGGAYYVMWSGPGSIDPVTGVWTYQPSLSDVGPVHHVEVSADFCYYCGFDVVFTNSAPTIACGQPYLPAHSAIPLIVTIADDDSDPCDTGLFSLVGVVPFPVGPYSLDASTGLFTFIPDPLDGGLDYSFTFQYTDGAATVMCDLTADVVTGCCYLRGDASGDLEGPNVADITAFVGWLFGTYPVIPCWWALDVNNDLVQDIRDLTYLVKYLFRSGPAPVPCPFEL